MTTDPNDPRAVFDAQLARAEEVRLSRRTPAQRAGDATPEELAWLAEADAAYERAGAAVERQQVRVMRLINAEHERGRRMGLVGGGPDGPELAEARQDLKAAEVVQQQALRQVNNLRERVAAARRARRERAER